MAKAQPIDLFDRLLGTSGQLVTLQPGWTIQLQAKHPPRNIFRSYTICVDKNLFGEWCLSISCGRIGQQWQAKRYFWSDSALLITQMKATLRRRLNATKRIGCNHEIVAFSKEH